SVPRSLNTPESSTNAWYSPSGVSQSPATRPAAFTTLAVLELPVPLARSTTSPRAVRRTARRVEPRNSYPATSPLAAMPLATKRRLSPGADRRRPVPVRLGGEPALAAAVRRDGEHEVARRRGRAHRREFRADFQVGVELQIACAGSGARPGPTFERRARRRDRLEVNCHARRHRRRAI